MPKETVTTQQQAIFDLIGQQARGGALGQALSFFANLQNPAFLSQFFGLQQAQPNLLAPGLPQLAGNVPQLGAPGSPILGAAQQNILGLLSGAAPEVSAFGQGQAALQPLLTGAPGGTILGAATPVFLRNLAEAQTGLAASAPGRFGSAFLQQGTNLAQRALQDFNLFAQQATQQDLQNRIAAATALGTLAQAAGQGPFQRALGAGGLGLEQARLGQQAGMFNIANLLGARQFDISNLLGAGQFDIANQLAAQQQAIQNRLGVQQDLMRILLALSQPTGQSGTQITRTPFNFFRDILGPLAQVGGMAAGAAL